MVKSLFIISIVMLAALTANAQLENPRSNESPFAEAGKLTDVTENAKVYIVVKSAQPEKTTEALSEIIRKETKWTVVDSPKDADVAIQTSQERRQGWRKEYGMGAEIVRGLEFQRYLQKLQVLNLNLFDHADPMTGVKVTLGEI